MKSILVANPKGGCGKSTIATHLAAAFANGGFKTALADSDDQRSSLDWLARRPAEAAAIRGLDWTKAVTKPPKSVSRLVIDSAASLPIKEFRELVRAADGILVPILPSAFDLESTRHFLAKLVELKPLRKGRKGFLLVLNRVRPGSRAVKRLESHLAEGAGTRTAWLTERAIYNELAWRGLGIFDLTTQRARALQADWAPLVRFIESDPSIN